MNLQSETVEILNSTPIGRRLRQAIRPAVHLVRRIAHPGVPPNLQLSRLTCASKTVAILHRRTFADYTAIRQCFVDGQYDLPNGAHGAFLNDLYQRILSSGRKPLIVDCGSNIGASVLWFNTRYPDAHILAIEPAPDNFDLLRQNCARLDADLRQAGIAAEDGFAYLSDPGEGSLAYRTIPAGPGAELSMVSLSTLLAAKPSTAYVPFLLKLDIEGAEKNLFDGDCATINQFPLIIMEPHDWLLPGQLTSLGFFRFHAAAGRELVVNHENIASIACHAPSGNAYLPG
ncbi:FkbM family methyltransferase [Edaphobacter aggregans]|uniref:FkbM family methyltransferase n=1 Tax=Edaphobacter aggregans TaxID=570835 RepID=UPI00068933DC|nr:FkbM family methyltransferase [Edaphobacter aggregans]